MESEVVGISDYLPHTIWAKYFLSEQGYNLSRNIFYQDNVSAIKMATNGKRSCSGKSRHIHIRYFFSKDVIKRENLEMQYCPTKQMVADYYTKPLQGKGFYELRNIIMGTCDTFPVKECVEKTVKSGYEKVRKEQSTVTRNDVRKSTKANAEEQSDSCTDRDVPVQNSTVVRKQAQEKNKMCRSKKYGMYKVSNNFGTH